MPAHWHAHYPTSFLRRKVTKIRVARLGYRAAVDGRRLDGSPERPFVSGGQADR